MATTSISPAQNTAAIAGRLRLATIFLPAGLRKLSGFEGTVGSIAPASRPMPMVAAVLAVALEVRAGLALIARTGTRIAALALAFFTLVASFFHAYWGVPAKQQMVQQLLLFKNIAITGGLLTLAAWDPGEWSLSAHRDRT